MMTAGMVGYMQMPLNFKYKDVFLKGRPEHERWDSFLIKHPPMPAAKWAKIFSPFDALKGFSEAVASKEIQYVQKIELDDDEKRDLGRKLDVLHNLTWNGRMARANRVMVTVKYFIPCEDRDSFSFGTKGQYKELQGMVLRVDTDVELTLALQTETGRFKRKPGRYLSHLMIFWRSQAVRKFLIQIGNWKLPERKSYVLQILHGNVSGTQAIH